MNFAPKSVRAAEAPALAVALESAFDFSGAEYRALQRRACATAFQAPRWLDALHRELAPAFGAEQATVTVRDGARLMLVLPLARLRRHGVRFIEFADFGLCDYQGAIYDEADAPLLMADARLPGKIAAALPRYDVLALAKLTGGDVLERLFPKMRRARMRVSAYPARLGADWTAWRAERVDGSLRRDLEIKRRRLHRTGPTEFVPLREAGEIGRVFEALRRHRAARFKAIGAPDVLDNPTVEAFYRRMAIEGARDGSVRTEALMLSGEPIGVMYGLSERGVYYMLMVGPDITRHARLSPGLLAVEDSIRAAIEAGDRVYDFTIGDHPYKTQFGGVEVPLYEWHRARTVRGHLAVSGIALMREAKRRLKPWLKRAPAQRKQPGA